MYMTDTATHSSGFLPRSDGHYSVSDATAQLPGMHACVVMSQVCIVQAYGDAHALHSFGALQSNSCALHLKRSTRCRRPGA